MISKSFENLSKLDSINVVVNNISTFNTSVSAPALSGTFYGDGSRLTGVGTANALSLSGGTLVGGLTGTTARFTGNVSIGTAAEPTSRNGSVSRILQVVGTDNNVLNFTNTTLGRGAALEFNRTGRTNTRYAQIFAGTDASDNGSIRFLAAPAGSDALTEHVIIDSQGDLGIGTLTPNEKLTVVGNISATGNVRGGTATFNTSVSAPAFFGDGSGLTGIVGGGGTANALPLSGGTLMGGLTGTTAVFTGNVLVSGSVTVPAGSYLNFATNSNGHTAIYRSGSGNGMEFFTVSNSRMFIADAGNVGIGTTTPNSRLTVNGNISAGGVIYGTGGILTGALSGTTATFSTSISAPALSGTFFGDGSRLTGVGTANALPLSGGDISSNLNIGGNLGVGIANPTVKVHVVGNSRLQGDVTITGNLSCTGTQTFTNTVFTTTSAVSVVNFGPGAALYVGNNGSGDIASFYDIDANVEVLHVGGNNGTFPNVGIKTSAPTKTLTVAGEISATQDITTSSNFVGIRATLTSSVSAPALSGAHFGDGSRLTGIVDATRLPLSGGTMAGPLNLVTTTETKATPSIASNALSLDLATATFFSVSVNSNVTFTFANTPASPRVYSFMLQLIGDGTVRTITWPAAVRWGGGVPPAVTSTLNKVDTFSFLTHDGGTNWFGFIVDQNS